MEPNHTALQPPEAIHPASLGIPPALVGHSPRHSVGPYTRGTGGSQHSCAVRPRTWGCSLGPSVVILLGLVQVERMSPYVVMQ